ncbi:hypothetical protein KP509_18G063300 [Ceratopteris richardii]|nr:hypothetical protein KP509_18G063300 [Ceratopteris richardii]
MYICFGWIVEAQCLFDKLSFPGVVLWTSLITGWVKHGNSEEALRCFEKMQLAGTSPDVVTFISGLKACSLTQRIEKGMEMHAEIERKDLLGKSLSLDNALVHMYARYGLITTAQEVFELLPCRDVASWTLLISGYADAGHGEEALEIYDLMQSSCILPNAVTYTCTLKACSVAKKPCKGQELHSNVEAKNLLAGNILMGNALVDMYAKCGLFVEAEHLFNKLITRDVSSWNVMIGGYVEHGHGKEALLCFKHMQLSGLYPNDMTFLLSLKACTMVKTIDTCLEIHAEIARRGLVERGMDISCALVDMYAQCSSMDRAQEVFDKIVVKDVSIWNVLISGYNEIRNGEKAINCFEKMQTLGVLPDSASVVYCVKAYFNIGAMCKIDEMLADIGSSGLKIIDFIIGTTFVDIYSKLGLLQKAQHVFDKLQKRSVISWNSLIAGYTDHEQGEKALECLEQMKLEGVSPNAVTFIHCIKACGIIKNIDKGIEIHAEVLRIDLMKNDLHIGTTLIDMYTKCGDFDMAVEVFEGLRFKDVIPWNALIGGYVECGFGEQAIVTFESMQIAGIAPDIVTYVCALKACGITGAIDKGREIHIEVFRKGLQKKDRIGNATVDMYVKCGMLSAAQEVFDNISSHSIVSWNTLLAGYVDIGLSEQALKYFTQMQEEGVHPNHVSFVYLLKACGGIGAIAKGRELHAEIERHGLLQQDLVGTAVVDMYGKCSLLALAQEVFDKLSCRSTVSWNLLIANYAEQGESSYVLEGFRKMREEGFEPDCVTFVVVLGVCGQMGLYGKGKTYFASMVEDYGIPPTLEHITCMINLFGQIGDIDKLVIAAKNFPFSPDLALCRTLLVASMKVGNVELGMSVFQQALHLNGSDPTAYVLMSYICAATAALGHEDGG